MSDAPIGGVAPSAAEGPATQGDATSATEVPASKAPVVEKRKVIINGKEREVSLDEVLRDYQKYQAADERFAQASKIRKGVDTILEKVKKAETIEDLADLIPKDQFRKLAEKMFLEEMEWEQLPEAEKKARALEKRAALAENRLKSIEEEKANQARQYMRERAHKEIDEEIAEAFKTSGLNPTPERVIRVAQLMLASLGKPKEGEAPKPRMRASDALNRVLEGLWGEASDLLSAGELDQIRKRLPKKFLDGLRKSDVEAARSQDVILRKQPNLPKNESSPTRTKQKRMKTDDWFSQMEKKFGGK